MLLGLVARFSRLEVLALRRALGRSLRQVDLIKFVLNLLNRVFDQPAKAGLDPSMIGERWPSSVFNERAVHCGIKRVIWVCDENLANGHAEVSGSRPKMLRNVRVRRYQAVLACRALNGPRGAASAARGKLGGAKRPDQDVGEALQVGV